MWTVGLTVEVKLRFLDGLVWTVGLTVEIKLRFLDGLVWTVGLTVEVKLRFLDGLVLDGRLNRRNKVAFSTFSSAVWRGPNLTYNNVKFRSYTFLENINSDSTFFFPADHVFEEDESLLPLYIARVS